MLFFSRVTILALMLAVSNALTHFAAKLAYQALEPFKNGTSFRGGSERDESMFPDYVNWVDKGYVTEVKSQWDCRSGWAFAAIGALEGQYSAVYGALTSFSEQNLIDCSKDYCNNGCSGGENHLAFHYIDDVGGVETEVSYPYEGKDGSCRFNEQKIKASIQNYVVMETEDEDDLKKAVATIEPIAVMIDASLDSFQSYSTGIYYDEQCDKTSLNHGVLVVGYGTDHGEDYWLVKNSNGTVWGEHGYIRMARNKDNACGIANLASYPVL